MDVLRFILRLPFILLRLAAREAIATASAQAVASSSRDALVVGRPVNSAT